MILAISLVIYLLICYYLLREEDMVTTNEKILEMAKRQVAMKRRAVETEYYFVIDELEQKLAKFHPYLEDLNLDLQEFSLVYAWNVGAMSSEDVLSRLQSINLTEASENKLLNKLNKTLDGVKDSEVAMLLANALHDLETKVVPLYEKYLKTFKVLLHRFKQIDEKQIKIVHGRTRNGDTHQIREIPLNQAIRYIKANGLKNRKEVYLMCGHVVTFEDRLVIDGQSMPSDVDWFLAPGNYAKIICELFNVKTKVFNSKEKEFYDNLEQTIKSLKKVV